jgi:glutamate N-acetyltransferase/amino-acid N-acetyltransferase
LRDGPEIEMTNITITAPKGFLAAGVSCEIKQSGNKDLGLIACPTGALAAAVFTTNKIVAAPVTISRKNVTSQAVYGVVVNSGNANACTGEQGLKNALAMCQLLAKEVDARPEQILVASTGIIGHQLPMKNVKAGILDAAAKLENSAEAGLDFATAIMTTDTRPKQAFRQIKIDNHTITIAGTVKGAGMIAPRMATTLCFITTDIAVKKSVLKHAFKIAIRNSLNRFTVDGHQSTNDTAILLASGLAGNEEIRFGGAACKLFAAALRDLCEDLMKQMALDAEGATRMFKVVIEGAAGSRDAAIAARAVADYALFKCAVHGSDPNWGRIICAIGSSRVRLKLGKLSCKIGDVTVFKNGEPTAFDAKKVSKLMSQKEHTITINLGIGRHSDFCYGCDLGREYVTINADYHT